MSNQLSREIVDKVFENSKRYFAIIPHLQRFVDAHCHRFSTYEDASIAELSHAHFHVFRLYRAEFDRHLDEFLSSIGLTADEVAAALETMKDDRRARTFLSFISSAQDIKAFAALMRASYNWNKRQAAKGGK